MHLPTKVLLLVGLLLVLISASATPVLAVTGDFNNDGLINTTDYSLLVSHLHTTDCVFNLTGSCFLDLFDVNTLLPLLQSGGSTTGSILIYDVEKTDPTYSGTVRVGVTPHPLKFRLITSADYGYGGEVRTLFRTYIARLAASGQTQYSITLPADAAWSKLYSAEGSIPTQTSGRTVTFTLPPGSGSYVLKTSVRTGGTGNYIESLVFWVDDYSRVALSPPPGALSINPTDNLQAAIDRAAPNTTFFIKPGLHQYKQILIQNKQNISLILHPNALMQQDPLSCSSAACYDFIKIDHSRNITIAGPGEIRTLRRMGLAVINSWYSDSVTLRDFFLYKIHHRDGGQINSTKNKNGLIEYVRIIGQNGGYEADSSDDMHYNHLYVEGQDDGIAIKSRRDTGSSNIVFENSIVRSGASALKIGEATVLQPITNIQFLNNTVLDSDRGFVVKPRGANGGRIGSIGYVLYKNNRIRDMYKTEDGQSIIVDTSTDGNPFNSGTNIVFENNDTDFVESALFDFKATIKDSIIRMKRPTNVFSGRVCPTQTNVKIIWENGKDDMGC